MSRSLRVLISEDSEDDARLLVRELSKLGYRPEHRRIEDRAGMQTALQQESWDLILCDYSMPQFNALDALHLVQELKLDIPFIIISDNVGEDVAVQAMKAGAHDYLMKGQLSRLGEAIERELAQVKIRAEHAKGLARVTHLNHVLQAVRGINRLIVQEKDPQSLCQRAAELLVETRGYQNAAFVRTDREETAFPFVSVLDKGERKNAALEPMPLSDLPACLRTAAEAKHALVLEVDQPKCTGCQFRELHAGKVRLAGPLAHAGKTFGFAVISLPQGLAIHEAEQELFEEMIGDVAFALHGIELAERERQSQARFQRLYENMAQGVVYQNAKGQVIHCNKAAELILGLSLSQMQGRTSMDPRWKAVRDDGSEFPGEEHPATLALRKGVPTRGVMGVLNPAQSQHRWISISAVPEFEAPDGPPSGVFATFEDITDLRNTEHRLGESLEALEESNRRFEKAQEMGKIANYEYDIVNNTYWASNEAKRIYGYSWEIEDFSYDDVWKCIPDKEFVNQAWVDLVERDKPYNIEHEIRPVSGPSSKIIKAIGEVVRDKSGNPIKVIGLIQDVTEQRRLQAQLLEAQNIAGLGRWEFDLRDNILQWSESIYGLFEVDSASFEATYEAFLGFVHPDDREALDSAFRESVEKKTRYSLVHRLQMADGRIKWVKESGHTIYSGDGTPLRSVGTVQDVTDLKKAEDDLGRREQQYRSLFDGAPVGIFRTTSQGRVLSVNPALATMLGFQSAEDAQSSFDDLGVQLYANPRRRDEFIVEIDAAGELTGFEYEARTKDGRSIWLNMSARVAERFDDGSFTIEGFTNDITRRRQLEQEIARSEQLLKLTGSLAKVGGWEFDLASSSAFLTEEVLRIYDLPLDYLLPPDQGITYYHPDDRPKVQQAFNRAAERGEPYELEVRLISAKGNHKWVRTMGQPHYTDGKLTKLYGIIEDISERKRREAARGELEVQFNQAQKMESVGRLAGGVAHDFNNHLSVISSYARFVANALREGDPMLEDIRQVERAGKRAANLTRQLLAFSRKQVLEPRVLNLNDVIADIEKMVMRLIGEDIEIQMSLAEDVGLVLADEGQIEQVLMNLAVNARDAMPHGGRLTIETAAVDLSEEHVSEHADAATGPHIMLAVSDDGEGMSAETKERLFEPFFTTKEKGHGTGLGLATVYGIVKQSGGHIRVYSEQGHGTTIKIYLPRTESKKAIARPAPPVLDLRGTETVLVVEDEEAIRLLARRILQSAGYEVLTAANGGEALLEWEKHGDRIQLLLTDVIMPKLSGRELADRLKVMCPGLRVLFMSGYTDNAIAHHDVLDAGFHFIAKPFDANDILRKVRMVLDGAN